MSNIPKFSMEALVLSPAVNDVHAERQKQLDRGYNDDCYTFGDLRYLAAEVIDSTLLNSARPAWVPPAADKIIEKHHETPRQLLVIAAALLLAEIERMDRVPSPQDTECPTCGIGFRLPSGVCDHCNCKFVV